MRTRRVPSPNLSPCLALALSAALGLSASSAHALADARAAYLEAARAFAQEHRLPDGEVIDPARIADRNFADNKLAIRDVDGDGRPELLVKFETAPMAGKREYVYGLDEGTGKIVEKLSGFPGIEYYDNGCAKEPRAHNQGLAGEHFWPFTLYRLDARTGRHEFMGNVDAWSEKEFPQGYGGNKPFPKQVDAVGDGYVYFINTDPETDFTDKPADTPEYRAWLDRCVGGASPVKVDWVSADAAGLEALRRQE